MAHSLHWLEITEYVSLATSVIGLVVAAVSNHLFYAIVPMLVSLLLNLINRYRFEQRIRRRTTATINRMAQKLLEEVKLVETELTEHARLLKEKESPQLQLAGDFSPGDAFDIVPLYERLAGQRQLIASLQKQSASFEESIKNLIDYLNRSSLPTRVDHLEKALAQITTSITRIIMQIDNITLQLPAMPEENQPVVSGSPPPATDNLTSPSLRQVFSPKPWICTQTLSGHSDWVRAVAISPHQQLLVSGSFDRTIKVWSMPAGEAIYTLSGHSKAVFALAISPDGHTCASGSWDNTIKLWHLDTGELIDTLSDHTGSVRTVAISSDGLILVSGSFDKTIKLWHLGKKRLYHTLTDYVTEFNAVVLSPDSQIIASGGEDGIIRLWQLDTCKFIRFLTGNLSSVCSLAISPDSKILVAGNVKGMISLWHLDTGELTTVIPAHSGPVTSCVFHPDGQTFISGSTDGNIKIWYLETELQLATSCIQVLTDDSASSVLSIAISSDGKTIAAGSADGTIKIWQLEQ